MVFESKPADAEPACGASAPSCQHGHVRFRLRFRKGGDLRLVSHHDLMHVFERMLRRAELPVVQTKGFHPHPKMTFALSLALGVVGVAEIVDLDVAGNLSADEVMERLARQSPPGLEILDVRAVDPRGKARVCRAWYRCEIPDGQAQGLAERIAAFLASSASWVERTRPQPRRLNIRPYVNVLRLAGPVLEMGLWITPYGAARPEEVLSFLGLSDFYETGELILERSSLELEDEVPAEVGPMPDVLQNASNQRDPQEIPQNTIPSGVQERKSSAAAAESATRPTSLISNPLAFDS